MSDKDKEPKENGLNDYGIIYLSGPINGGTAEGICKQIIEYNIKGEVNQLQMIINSPGGSCPAGFSIIDIMEWSRIPIYTTGIGTSWEGRRRHSSLRASVHTASKLFPWALKISNALCFALKTFSGRSCTCGLSPRLPNVVPEVSPSPSASSMIAC